MKFTKEWLSSVVKDKIDNLKPGILLDYKLIEQWIEEIKGQKEFANQKWDEKAGDCSYSSYSEKTYCIDNGGEWTSLEEEIDKWRNKYMTRGEK